MIFVIYVYRADLPTHLGLSHISSSFSYFVLPLALPQFPSIYSSSELKYNLPNTKTILSTSTTPFSLQFELLSSCAQFSLHKENSSIKLYHISLLLLATQTFRTSLPILSFLFPTQFYLQPIYL